MDDRVIKKAIEAFGDSTRYEILCLLRREGPLSVNEISVKVGKHRATVDKHLKLLSKVGFVTRLMDERRGVYVYMLTESAVRVLDEFDKAVKRGDEVRPVISIPVRKYRILRITRRIATNIIYAPSGAFLILGFIGFFAPVGGFLAKVIWLSIFLVLAWAWLFFIRSAFRR